MAFPKPTLIALLLAGALLPGCFGDEQGSASVYVKDAPTDKFDEIHVVFTKVEVHAADSVADDGDEAGDADDNETDDEGNQTGALAGWKTVFSNATGVDVDLLNASGARAAFLGEADLEAGKYTQVRVHVKEAYGVQNGTRVNITVSSGTLKLIHPFDVEADKETRIVLDFDLDRSLRQQGMDGAWRMTPVVGTVSADVVEDDASGEEAGDEAGEIEELES